MGVGMARLYNNHCCEPGAASIKNQMGNNSRFQWSNWIRFFRLDILPDIDNCFAGEEFI